MPGDPKLELNTLPFRLDGDLTLVSYQKRVMPLCQMLRSLAVDSGIGHVELEDHDIESRMRPKACLSLSFLVIVFPSFSF